MTPQQVQMVEETFATLTEDGWVVPPWVESLRLKVWYHQLATSRYIISLHTSEQTPIW